MNNAPFHLSLPCYDIEETRSFYVDRLGFRSGRTKDAWIDIDMAGCQLTFMKVLRWKFPDKYYQFEGTILPAFHFGVLLTRAAWKEMHLRCQEEGLSDEEPVHFLAGEPGAHHSFFIEDPNNYVIEFKCFEDTSEAFSS